MPKWNAQHVETPFESINLFRCVLIVLLQLSKNVRIDSVKLKLRLMQQRIYLHDGNKQIPYVSNELINDTWFHLSSSSPIKLREDGIFN